MFSKVAIAYAVVAWLLIQVATLYGLFEIARVLVRLGNIASPVVNANHSTM